MMRLISATSARTRPPTKQIPRIAAQRNETIGSAIIMMSDLNDENEDWRRLSFGGKTFTGRASKGKEWCFVHKTSRYY
jgi:hypothetical protein